MQEYTRGTAKIAWSVVVMVIVAPVIAVWVFWWGVSYQADYNGGTVAADRTIRLREGWAYDVRAEEIDLPPQGPGARCTVTGPGGHVRFRGVPFEPSPTVEERRKNFYTLGSFVPTETGEHRVVCPPHASVELDDVKGNDHLAGWALVGCAGAVAFGGLVFALGLALFILGVHQATSRRVPPPAARRAG